MPLTKTVLQMQGAEQPSRAPLTLFTFDHPEAIKDYALGCDADVGGTSTVHLDFDDDPACLPPPSRRGGGPTTTTDTDATGTTGTGPRKRRGGGVARFHGQMSLAVRPGYEQRIRGGYAGFRNKVYIYRPYSTPPPAIFFFSFCHTRPELIFLSSFARRYSASSRMTCRTTDTSPCACELRDTRARAVRTLSTYRRRVRRTTICGSTGCILRGTMVGGKMSLCVLNVFTFHPCPSSLVRLPLTGQGGNRSHLMDL
jgi:hypothetical protein